MTASYGLRQVVRSFTPYVPGESIEKVRARFCLHKVIKMASNENPLGVSPLVEDAIKLVKCGQSLNKTLIT